MTQLGRETVEHVAKLAKLALSDAEKDLLMRQLGEVLLYMERLNEVDTRNVPPTTHVVELENVTRQDVPAEPLARSDVMRNAPEHRDGMFIVPRVIEGETKE
ncbi:MAG TPA: Asp-tRNA(Asn)/Glu-tRNA(Gln) amidotransferase subunit GatC [bacterium]|nr:Asp-tRNA(Asn)/Glu-tRNA(Gln) amidotransferase subunit GatC [bacterium]